jgi:hypothetical protein
MPSRSVDHFEVQRDKVADMVTLSQSLAGGQGLRLVCGVITSMNERDKHNWCPLVIISSFSMTPNLSIYC